MNKRKNINSMRFIMPALVIITLFSFYPMVRALITSFQMGVGASTSFGGLVNYQRLIGDALFHQTVITTFLFLIIQVPVMTLLALVAAALLNSRFLRFRSFFRLAIFLPCVTSLVAYSVLFKSLFASNGLINEALLRLHIVTAPIPWFTDPFWAKVLIIIALTWRWTGYAMIFYLAGMQNIDDSLYEVARIDGASSVRQFFSITIPLLKPIILLNLIMSTNGTLQLFDEPMNLTQGGPLNATTTIAQYIYDLSFKFVPNFGYASAVSFTIVVMVAVLTFVQFKVIRND